MKFDIKSFFKKNWQHFAVVGFFFLITIIYFSPAFNGYTLKQADMQNFMGMSTEIKEYQEEEGELIHWTNSMFSGMPTTLITSDLHGNKTRFLRDVIGFAIPTITWAFIFSLISFYILTQSFKIKPLIGAIGSMSYALTSYLIIVIKVGHTSKALAMAFVPLVVAGFYYVYRRNWKLGALISLLAMNFELMFNHIQITYYLGFILIFLGIIELIQAVKDKTIPVFLKKTGILAGVYVITLLVNYSSLFGTLEYSKNSIRGKSELTLVPNDKVDEQTSGLNRSYITSWSYGKEESFSFIIPNAKGGVSRALGADEELMKTVDAKFKTDPNFNIPQNSQYWGDQDYVEGPVYLGAIIVFLFVLGMVYVKDKLKWGVLGVTLLGLLLSWGANLPSLTNFFIDNVPFYNKFRAVSMNLIILEFTFPFLVLLFLKELFENPKSIKENPKGLYVVSGIFGLFFLALLATPDSFLSFNSNKELDSYVKITEQINKIPDANQQGQIMASFSAFQTELITVRKSIFQSDLLRSFLFIILAFGIVFLITIKQFKSKALLIGGLGLLIMIDLFAVDKRYLDNSKEKNNKKNYTNWILKEQLKYPFAIEQGDLSILQMEMNDPKIAAFIQEEQPKIDAHIKENDFKGVLAQNYSAYKLFRILDKHTHYRVHDINSGFSSGRGSYFHKTIGGYHGAKLKKYQELWDFYFLPDSKYLNNYTGQEILNMLNAKYMLRSMERGAPRTMQQNFGALGNAWVVSNVKWVDTPDEEILALGDTINRFSAKTTAIVNTKYKDIIGEAGNGIALVELDSYHPETLEYTYNSSEDQIVVFSEIFYPENWHATIDGEAVEIVPVNYVLRGIKVPAGDHKIIMHYDNPNIKSFNQVSLAGSIMFFLAFGGLLFLIIKGDKKSVQVVEDEPSVKE